MPHDSRRGRPSTRLHSAATRHPPCRRPVPTAPAYRPGTIFSTNVHFNHHSGAWLLPLVNEGVSATTIPMSDASANLEGTETATADQPGVVNHTGSDPADSYRVGRPGRPAVSGPRVERRNGLRSLGRPMSARSRAGDAGGLARRQAACLGLKASPPTVVNIRHVPVVYRFPGPSFPKSIY
jgi:hypothetical protein